MCSQLQEEVQKGAVVQVVAAHHAVPLVRSNVGEFVGEEVLFVTLNELQVARVVSVHKIVHNPLKI